MIYSLSTMTATKFYKISFSKTCHSLDYLVTLKLYVALLSCNIFISFAFNKEIIMWNHNYTWLKHPQKLSMVCSNAENVNTVKPSICCRKGLLYHLILLRVYYRYYLAKWQTLLRYDKSKDRFYGYHVSEQ